MEEVDKEISEMKLSLNARARVVAESYLTAVSASSWNISQPVDVARSSTPNGLRPVITGEALAFRTNV